MVGEREAGRREPGWRGATWRPGKAPTSDWMKVSRPELKRVKASEGNVGWGWGRGVGGGKAGRVGGLGGFDGVINKGRRLGRGV